MHSAKDTVCHQSTRTGAGKCVTPPIQLLGMEKSGKWCQHANVRSICVLRSNLEVLQMFADAEKVAKHLHGQRFVFSSSKTPLEPEKVDFLCPAGNSNSSYFEPVSQTVVEIFWRERPK